MIDSIIQLIAGGGLLSLITAIVTMKFTRKQAEASAMKEMQDVYQQLIIDLRADKEAMKQEKGESEKKMLTKLSDMELKLNEMEKKVNENNRQIVELKAMKCTNLTCQIRKQ